MRFHVLAEAVRKEMPRLWQLYGRKRQQAGMQPGNLRIRGAEKGINRSVSRVLAERGTSVG